MVKKSPVFEKNRSPVLASAVLGFLMTGPTIAHTVPATGQPAEALSATTSEVLISKNLADASLADQPVTNTRDLIAADTAPSADGMEQVTSVSQLTDVKPTDWAFQALQSLVERYGCIVGYPEKPFGATAP